MSAFERAIEERAAAQKQQRDQEAKVEAQKARGELVARFENLDRIMRNPDVQWLLAEFQKRVDAERENALNDALPDPQAQRARQRHAAIKQLADWLPQEHREAKNALMDEKSIDGTG